MASPKESDSVEAGEKTANSAVFKERLEIFFKFHDTQRLGEVPTLAEKYGSSQEEQTELIQNLVLKYGPEPPAVRERRLNATDSSLEREMTKHSVPQKPIQPAEPAAKTGLFSAVKKKATFFSGSKSKPRRQSSADASSKPTHTSFSLADSETHMKTFTIQPGNAHGWLYRSWETLHKWRMYYYVFDFGNLLMYECESEDRTIPPRNTLSLVNTRVSEECLMIGSLFCWNLFIRSDQEGKAPKIFKLGVQTQEQYDMWTSCLRTNLSKQARSAAAMAARLQSGITSYEGSESGSVSVRRVTETMDTDEDVGDEESSSDEEDVELGTERASSAGGSSQGDLVAPGPANSSSSQDGGIVAEDLVPAEPTAVEGHEQTLCPTVIIGGRRYNLRCVSTATNAWLLSETIRVYMRENNNRDPEIVQLYNSTRNINMELSDDIKDSFRPGDVIQAITAASSSLVEPGTPGPDTASVGGDSMHSGAKGPGKSWYRKQRGDSAGVLEEAKLPPSLFPEQGLPPAPDVPRSKADAAHPAERSSKVHSVVGSAGVVASQVGWGESHGSGPPDTLWNSVQLRQLAVEDLGSWVPAKALDTAKRLLRAPHAMVPEWLSVEWNSGTLLNNVRVFGSSQQPSALVSMALVPASPSQVLDCVVNVHQQSRWDPLYAAGSILEIGQRKDVVHVHHKSMLLSPLGPTSRARLPVVPREFCIGRTWKRFDDGSFMLVLFPEVHACAQATSPLSVVGELKGGYIIRPIEISTGAEYSLVMQMVDVDMKGWLPSSLSKQAKFQCASSLAGLREYISWAVNEVP